jgi:hypothetical protein
MFAYVLLHLEAFVHFGLTFFEETVLELIFGILRIKSPSWSSSFLAGRRLTSKLIDDAL